MTQRLPFRFPATDGDVERLRVLLKTALTGVRFHPEKVSVLNCACGRADETGALAAALAPAEIRYYLGIDLRPEAIAEATKRWSLPGGNIEFRCQNAAAIDRMKSLPVFDFVFIRHQNYWNDPAVWDRILTHALAALTPAGILVCTSYFDHEHELLKAAVTTLGAELWWDARHLGSRPLHDVPGKSVDRHLALFGLPAK